MSSNKQKCLASPSMQVSHFIGTLQYHGHKIAFNKSLVLPSLLNETKVEYMSQYRLTSNDFCLDNLKEV